MVNAKHCEPKGYIWDASSMRIQRTTKMWLPLLDEQRTANDMPYESGCENHSWKEPYNDTNGEHAGPILTMEDWNVAFECPFVNE